MSAHAFKEARSKLWPQKTKDQIFRTRRLRSSLGFSGAGTQTWALQDRINSTSRALVFWEDWNCWTKSIEKWTMVWNFGRDIFRWVTGSIVRQAITVHIDMFLIPCIRDAWKNQWEYTRDSESRYNFQYRLLEPHSQNPTLEDLPSKTAQKWPTWTLLGEVGVKKEFPPNLAHVCVCVFFCPLYTSDLQGMFSQNFGTLIRVTQMLWRKTCAPGEMVRPCAPEASWEWTGKSEAATIEKTSRRL